ncbi:DUF2752 domain-containing protein [Arenimonas alkanexedens]
MPATTDRRASQARRWLALGLSAAALGTAAVLLRFDPTAPGSPLPPCPFHWATGLFCPGCGSTRTLHALLHGDVATAMAMNPLLVLSLPLVALLLAQQLGWTRATWQPALDRIGDARVWAVLLIGYGVLRNLPWLPFTSLAPGV